MKNIQAEVIFTRGALSVLSSSALAAASLALNKIKQHPKVDFVILDPQAKEEKTEDGGRTLRVPSKLPWKIWAILDDYGSPQTLSENLGYPTGTRYLLTLLLPEEY